jgi:CHAT domain-containing protein
LFGEVHSEVALSYSNLSNTYTALGDYTRALIFARKGLDIYLRTYGEIHWEVGFAYRNLGLAHEKSGDLLQAKACYKKSLEIRKKTRGEKFHEYATSLSDLGNIDFKMGNFSNSEKLHNQCIEIMTNTLHGNHPFFIQPYQNIGTIYSATGRHEQAKSTLRKALKLTEIHYGAYHPLMATFYSQLGSVCFDEGKLSEADVFFQKARQVDKEVLQRYFPTLSDKEAEDFYNSGENNRLINKAFLIETGKNNPLQRANLYNHLLFYKSLLLNTSARWKQRIKTSGDTKLFQQFVEWEKLQKSISKIITTETPENPQIIDSMVNAAERLEKDLSKRSENFAKKEDKKSRDWKEIQKVLNPGEAAIEMIRFRKYGINRWVTDTTDYQQKNYAVRGLTDTVQYAALIVTKNCIHPEMVILPNGNNLEGKWFHYYWNNIQQKQAESKSYPQFWEPISDKLKGIKKIWFSPDGVYHKINLNTLKNPKTGKLLSEEIELSLLGSTKDLLNLYPDESENRLACLLGNPDFSPGNSSNNSRSRSGPELYYFLKPNAGAEIPELPGSRAEVDSIAYLLQNKGWEVQQFAGKDASEDKVKDSYKPRVMLLSTHGFFRPDTSNESNPLVRSGLLLAGASKTLREGYSGHGEDGILTAYEAMNLNLDNTELVILSACETGLGEIKNGEGVYGLQRAFQVAGARNLIMSLWKVDDEVTQQLMVRFFRHWLSGKNKHNAFNMARNEIRLRHPEPYYWGGFVMLGK